VPNPATPAWAAWVVGRTMSCRKIAGRTRSGWRWPQRGTVQKLAFELLLPVKMPGTTDKRIAAGKHVFAVRLVGLMQI
jgi:hypothetical protein